MMNYFNCGTSITSHKHVNMSQNSNLIFAFLESCVRVGISYSAVHVIFFPISPENC